MGGQVANKQSEAVTGGRTETHSPKGRCCPASPGPEARVLALQNAAGNRAVSKALKPGDGDAPPIVQGVINSGGGQPLDAETRGLMESRLGADFEGVRIHSDTEAARSTRAVNARAYTVGSHVVFDRGTYNPHTLEGQRLLAHELAHVMQQAPRPGAGTSSTSAEAEASSAGRDVASGQGAQVRSAVPVGVQREERGGKVHAETNPQLNKLFRALAQYRFQQPAADFARFLGQNEAKLYPLLHPFGYAGSKKTVEDTVRDFDKAYNNWARIIAEAGVGPSAGLPKPARNDAQQKMWATAASDPIAAAFIVTGYAVSETLGKLMGFEQDPEKAAAGGKVVSHGAGLVAGLGQGLNKSKPTPDKPAAPAAKSGGAAAAPPKQTAPPPVSQPAAKPAAPTTKPAPPPPAKPAPPPPAPAPPQAAPKADAGGGTGKPSLRVERGEGFKTPPRNVLRDVSDPAKATPPPAAKPAPPPAAAPAPPAAKPAAPAATAKSDQTSPSGPTPIGRAYEIRQRAQEARAAEEAQRQAAPPMEMKATGTYGGGGQAQPTRGAATAPPTRASTGTGKPPSYATPPPAAAPAAKPAAPAAKSGPTAVPPPKQTAPPPAAQPAPPATKPAAPPSAKPAQPAAAAPSQPASKSATPSGSPQLSAEKQQEIAKIDAKIAEKNAEMASVQRQMNQKQGEAGQLSGKVAQAKATQKDYKTLQEKWNEANAERDKLLTKRNELKTDVRNLEIEKARVKGPTIKPGVMSPTGKGEKFSPKTRDQALADDPSHTCVYCGRPGTARPGEPTQVDHAIPQNRGGADHRDNAQLTCEHCNKSKGDNWAPVSPPPGVPETWKDHWPQWLKDRMQQK